MDIVSLIITLEQIHLSYEIRPRIGILRNLSVNRSYTEKPMLIEDRIGFPIIDSFVGTAKQILEYIKKFQGMNRKRQTKKIHKNECDREKLTAE